MLSTLASLIPLVTDAELSFIAGLNYGLDFDRQLAALHEVLQVQQACFIEGQYYYPYEVVELGAHSIALGHEREFVLCTLLVINAVITGFDSATDLTEKFAMTATVYDALPEDLKEVVLKAYLEADGG